MQVDWAGDTAAVIDTDTGEIIPAYVFVATLPYSGYNYVEAFFSMNQELWTAAHVNAYKYFGGVTRIIQCDNLKTGVRRRPGYSACEQTPRQRAYRQRIRSQSLRNTRNEPARRFRCYICQIRR